MSNNAKEFRELLEKSRSRGWKNAMHLIRNVTHWKPLPLPPTDTRGEI